jgi:hypothetical protein
MIAVALVGAGEAVAARVSDGDADVDDAAELMINLFWRGRKGTPADTQAHPANRLDPARGAVAAARDCASSYAHSDSRD